MSKSDGMSEGSYKRLSVLFAFLGVVFFAVGAWKLVSYIRFIGGGEPVNAVVVEVDEAVTNEWDGNFERSHTTTYAIYVTYTYKGKTYEHIRLDGFDNVYEGSDLKVYVSPDDPTDARLPGNNLYQSIVMMVLLPIFIFISRQMMKSAEKY